MDQRVRLLNSSAPQFLRRDAQRPIEFTGSVLPRDRRRQLDQSIIVIEFAQSREEFFADVLTGDGHRVSELQREPFRFRKQFTVCVIQHCFDLLIGDAEPAAHGSVDVLSKLAAIEERNPTINQCSQTRIY